MMGRRLEGGDEGRSCVRSDGQSGTGHVSCLRKISILCLVFGFVALGLPGRVTGMMEVGGAVISASSRRLDLKRSAINAASKRRIASIECDYALILSH